MPYSLALKSCTVCHQEKQTDLFPKHGRYKHGVIGTCWDCYRAKHLSYQRRYRATEAGKRSIAAGKLRARYGITQEQYDEMLAGQSGVCAICGDGQSRKKLGVDHDHTTGLVRGLLCDPCNKGLGHFRDDPNLFEKAIAYISEER